MLGERYSIYVSDYIVEIYGDLTIREAFDFIHFFDQQGFTHVVIGNENSTIRMMKKVEEDSIEPPNLYEVLLKDQQETCRQLKEQIKFQNEFIQSLINDHNGEVNCLKNVNDQLCKEKKMNEMMQNSLVTDMFHKLQEGAQDERH